MRLDEPVRRGEGDLVDFDRGGEFAALVTDGQGVQPGDCLVPLVPTLQGCCSQAVVPDLGPFEIALVQADPHHMVEPIQPFATRHGHGGLAEGLQGGEACRGGAFLHAPGQLDAALAGLGRGLGSGRDAEAEEQDDNERKLYDGHAGSVLTGNPRTPTLS